MKNLSLKQLRAVVEIARTGKVSKAANNLRVTGPAVTLQLRQIETELGVTLFERGSEQMIPTDAGHIVIECARGVLNRLEQLEDEIDQIANGSSGRVSLGVVSTAKYFAPRLIAGFVRENSGIDVQLVVGNKRETIDSLRTNAIDIALMGRPPRNVSVNAAIFGDHPLVIIAPPDHPLAGRSNIPKHIVAREKFLLRERGSGTRLSSELFFSEFADKVENPGVDMGSNETIKQAVAAGLGLAFISAHTIEQELRLNSLVILDVVDTPINGKWFSVMRNDRHITPAIEKFLRYMDSDARRYLPHIPALAQKLAESA